MASKLRVRISDNNRYVTNKDDVSYAPCRLISSVIVRLGRIIMKALLNLWVASFFGSPQVVCLR